MPVGGRYPAATTKVMLGVLIGTAAVTISIIIIVIIIITIVIIIIIIISYYYYFSSPRSNIYLGMQNPAIIITLFRPNQFLKLILSNTVYGQSYTVDTRIRLSYRDHKLVFSY